MATDRLSTYPRLERWFMDHHAAPPDAANRVGVLIWSICKAMCMDDLELLGQWSRSLKEFFSRSDNTYQAFSEAENALAEAGMDFLGFATEIAELAVRMDRGEEHYLLWADIAHTCDVPVFRFLAAWTALNCGKLEECIVQCEAVDDPYACIYTVLGQAQLELGLAEEAIESLKIAVELAPQEVLALFQLAKAYHVMNRFELAWEALERLNALIPKNAEVNAFFAMIALTEDHTGERLTKAWERMADCFKADDVTPYQIGLMLDLAFQSKNQDRVAFLLERAPWQLLKTNREFMSNMPWILKKLDAQGWRHLAGPLLQQLTS